MGTIRRRVGSGGVSLVELLVALAIVGILAALVAPSFSVFIARQRTRAALDLLAADLYYARMLAIRDGRRVTLRFEDGGGCEPHRAGNRVVKGYRVVVLDAPERVARARSTRWESSRLCLQTNNSDTITFNSRGLLVPFSNRTVWATHGAVADSFTLSVLGRVYRRY